MKMHVDAALEQPPLRALHCELGTLSRPDGSASISQGDTCVMSAVYGPGMDFCLLYDVAVIARVVTLWRVFVTPLKRTCQQCFCRNNVYHEGDKIPF